MYEKIVNMLNDAVEAKLRGLSDCAKTAISVMLELGIEPPDELFDVAELEPSMFETKITFRDK